jgi:hypothetical protein
MIDVYDYQGIAVNAIQTVYVADYPAPLLMLPTGAIRAVDIPGFRR